MKTVVQNSAGHFCVSTHFLSRTRWTTILRGADLQVIRETVYDGSKEDAAFAHEAMVLSVSFGK